MLVARGFKDVIRKRTHLKVLISLFLGTPVCILLSCMLHIHMYYTFTDVLHNLEYIFICRPSNILYPLCIAELQDYRNVLIVVHSEYWSYIPFNYVVRVCLPLSFHSSFGLLCLLQLLLDQLGRKV